MEKAMTNKGLRCGAICGIVLLIGLPSIAQLAEQPCGGPPYHEFDFWLGKWKVTSPTRPDWSAESSIVKGNDGCSILETYQSQGGYTGNSINFYDRSDQQWHQTWIDNQGSALYLSGGLVDGRMVLADSSSRITWSVEADGRVRQLWESISEDGKSWTVAFDGYYEKAMPAAMSVPGTP